MPRGKVGADRTPLITPSRIYDVLHGTSGGPLHLKIRGTAPTAEVAVAYPTIYKIITSGSDEYSINLQIRKHLFQLRAAYFAAGPRTYLRAIPRDMQALITRNMQVDWCGRQYAYTSMLGLPWSYGKAPSRYEESGDMITMQWTPNLPGDFTVYIRVIRDNIYIGRNHDVDLHLTPDTCTSGICSEYTVCKHTPAAEIAQLAEDLKYGRIAPQV